MSTEPKKDLRNGSLMSGDFFEDVEDDEVTVAVAVTAEEDEDEGPPPRLWGNLKLGGRIGIEGVLRFEVDEEDVI